MSAALLREVIAIRRLLAERLPVPAPATPAGLVDFLLDPFELKVVRTVAASDRPLALKAIARRTGTLGRSGRATTRLRQTLAALLRRRVLVGERDQYMVNAELLRRVPELVRS